jgi:hypothetical protein
MTPITYKQYTIEEETEPWAIKYGWNYKVSLSGEFCFNADSIEEAKEEINNRTQWDVKAKSGRVEKILWLSDAVKAAIHCKGELLYQFGSI